jgi:hypothetical protein
MTTYDDMPKLPRRPRGRRLKENNDSTRCSIDFGADMAELRVLAAENQVSVSRLVSGMIGLMLRPYQPGEYEAATEIENQLKGKLR